MSTRQPWTVLVLGIAVFAAALRAEEKPVQGKLDSVTLYRGQALVTRVVPVAAGQGALQIVVGELPERIQSDSLYAGAEKGVHVRAVRYRARVASETARPEVRKIDADIEADERVLRGLASERLLLQNYASYLTKLETFVPPTVQAELKAGVLNAETLRDLTLFMFEERRKLADQSLKQIETERDTQKKLEELRQKRAELTQVQSKAEREAVVFLDKTVQEATTIRLSYLVDGATWDPAYNIHASEDMKKVAVEYNAVIQQMSGENWENVKLTLSTASPTLVSDSPELAPLVVTLAPHRPDAPKKAAVVETEYRAAQTSINQAEQQRQRTADFRGQVAAQWEMNVSSGKAQVLEYQTKTPGAGQDMGIMRARSSVLSVNYRLEGLTNVASRADQQMVRIADLSLPATMVNVAAPLLTESVYRQAHVVNDSAVSLLEGESSVYLDGDFVGRGSVPMVARGQKFVAGFGADPQLRAWREFISREEQIQGGNRVLTFKYRLVLDNYKAKPAAVRAFDRVPTSQEDIRTTLGELKDPLSADKEYLRAFRPNGILRWDIEVPAGSAAETARIVEYSFKIEFDRNMDIHSVFGGEKGEAAKREFEMKMMESR